MAATPTEIHIFQHVENQSTSLAETNISISKSQPKAELSRVCGVSCSSAKKETSTIRQRHNYKTSSSQAAMQGLVCYWRRPY